MTIITFGRAAAIAGAAMLTAGMPAAAFAQTAPTQAKAAPQSKARLYCVIEYPTGSHMATKTCKTREDWIKQDGYDPTQPD